MDNNHVSVLNIDLNAVDNNLNYFKSKLNPTTKTLVVVKAFGYGSSAIEIAKHVANKVDYFAVAYVDEGIALRNDGVQNKILVLHPQKQNLTLLVEHCLEPNIYSKKLLQSFLTVAKTNNLNDYPIHLKFNTGLNRLGFSQNDISEISSILKNEPSLKVTSIFSHIAASEDLTESEFTKKQIEKFNSCAKQIETLLGYIPMKHMLNTSGIINYATEAQFNMVRLGIGLYGFGNDNKETENLQNVIQLTSIISQIHTIEKGETIGYNRAFKASSRMKTATIPIGHADGISRQLGNGVGYVYIQNKKAPIVGNVCMDMIMVDITEIKCTEGDQVIIYKNNKHIENLAKRINTIPYEILTAISQRIKRVLTVF